MELLKHLYKYDAKSQNEQQFTLEVINLLKERGAEVTQDEFGNVYAVKGTSDTYPCVVAHLDEVHEPRSKKFQVVATDGGVIRGFDSTKKGWRHGIGADDKNGIWIGLKAMEKFDVLKVAFFPGEEIGCIGSSNANMEFFKDCRFVVECDRKNSSDFITEINGVELCSKEFLAAVRPEDWAYYKTDGLSTDVCSLKENGLSVSCCNMSCGYYNPHTPSEFTVFSELEKCLRFVEHIIADCTEVYKHEYVAKKYNRYYYGGYSRGYYGGRDYDDYDDYADWWEEKDKNSNIKRKDGDKLSDYLNTYEKSIYKLIIEEFEKGVYDEFDVKAAVAKKKYSTSSEWENAFAAAEEDFFAKDEEASQGEIDQDTYSEIYSEVYTMFENGRSESEVYEEIRNVWGYDSSVVGFIVEEAKLDYEAACPQVEEVEESGKDDVLENIAAFILKAIDNGVLDMQILKKYYASTYKIPEVTFDAALDVVKKKFESKGVKLPTEEEYFKAIDDNSKFSLNKIREILNIRFGLNLDTKAFDYLLKKMADKRKKNIKSIAS